MTVTTDFLSGLYNRESCYADRLTAEQLDAIHVPTRLRAFVAEVDSQTQ